MKIAVIHPDFKIKGGAENIIYWLCEELAVKKGWDVTVFSVDFASCEYKLKNIYGVTIRTIYVPKIFRNNQLVRLLFAPIHLAKNLINFDVINVHNYPASIWVGLANILVKRKLPKIVWSCNEPARFMYNNICNTHTPKVLQVLQSDLDNSLKIKTGSRIKFIIKSLYKPFLKYIDKKAVETFSKILTLSDFVRNHVKEIYGVQNVHTCYGCAKEINKNNSKFNETDNQYFLTVSRLEGCKNIQNIIEAFALLEKQNELKNIRYYIIGQGPFKKYLNDLVIKYKLSSKIQLLDYVKREDLLAYYNNCLCVIYLPFDEPFGLPYLEAASFSKPSIASNHGGPSELIVNGETGLLVDPSDVNEIAEAVKEMNENKSARDKMGENAFKLLKEKFVWEKYFERYLAFLQ